MDDIFELFRHYRTSKLTKKLGKHWSLSKLNFTFKFSQIEDPLYNYEVYITQKQEKLNGDQSTVYAIFPLKEARKFWTELVNLGFAS
jgi:hypothetical protein